ncbi:MAG: PAS domain S-box protein [Methanobacterium sp.]|nr:PAS domain S-box protein [Methanobacterium sp.]
MSKIRILLVENEGIEAMDIKRELESFGYSVPSIVADGENAIKTAEEIKPDLILMDIMLPGKIDGVEVSKKLKLLKIPVVYLTANSEPATFERAKETDPYGYIIKPFDSRELKYAIELAINKKKNENKIRVLENEFKHITEHSSDMIYKMNLSDGSYEYVNPAAEKITGYTLEEFYSSKRLLKDVIHPDFKDYYKETFKKLLEGKVETSFEYKILTKKGEEKWLNQRNNFEFDSDGKPVTINGVVTDITHQKAIEMIFKSLQNDCEAERERFKMAQKVAMMGIWENELATNDLKWSDQMYKILGLPIGTEVNLNDVVNIFPEEELKHFNNAVEDSIINNKPYSNDYRIVRPDGEVRYIHDEGQVIRDENGEALKMFGATQDITSRKKAENALIESEAKFRKFVETTPDMIWEIDGQVTFKYISPQSLQIMGYPPDKLIGTKIFDLIKPDSVEKVMNSFMEHLDTGQYFKTLVVPALDRAGKELLLEIRSAKVVEENNQVVGFEGIARDITDITRATNQLINSINEKNVLLKEIHHRVKNNMQIISSLLNLQMEHLTDKNAINALKESQNRIITMATLHEKLYLTSNFSRINQSEYVSSLIRGLFSSYTANNRIKSVIDVDPVDLNLETSIPCGLIINELVSNSLIHGFTDGRTGTITVSLKSTDDNYELRITDDGVGFPANINLDNITSLGLELVKNLVNQLDGTIELNQIGKTEFIVRFNEIEYKERF